MITINNIDDLSLTVIKRIIDNHKTTIFPRMEKLERYYANHNDILNRVTKDPSKPNNKIANSYASYITDTMVGYFMGEPVTYNCDDKELLEELKLLFEYNDEADENSELAKDASIYGVAFEELYVDEDGVVRFKRLDPKTVIPIYDKTIERKLIAAIRYYKDFDFTLNQEFNIVELITDKSITTFKGYGDSVSLEPINEIPHYFGMVPIAIFENNEDLSGDFEKVISLIDAYDKMESDTLNDQEYFTDAYLALYGYTADSEDIAKMKENRVLLMDEGTKAEWIIKTGNDTISENIKNRLDKDIHKFAKCPNLADEEFASNASGIAIKFKTLGTENLVSIKERKFKKGLQQRLELISMINSVITDGFDWRTINIIFTRNLPSNIADIASTVTQLSGLVSDETLLAQIPFVEDVKDELDKVKKQKEENKSLSPFFQADPDGYKTKAMADEEEEYIRAISYLRDEDNKRK